MFFKGKKPIDSEEIIADEIVADETEPTMVTAMDDISLKPSEAIGAEYAFYKPDPYPKELVSVLKSMLQRLFPDTKKAYILEAQKSDKKGYLLIVDIDSKFLKIINIYLDGETKKVRRDTPIECILFSKSGSLTEGIDPFYVKENAAANANNLASKEFSGDVVFSKMPEFELWAKSDKKDCPKPDMTDEPKASSQIKVKPTTKEELFAILNEYGTKKSDESEAIALTAIKEFEFYIPYTLGSDVEDSDVQTTLPVDENLKFKKLINPENELSAVPLFTLEDDAAAFAKRDKCNIAYIKYKVFASSRAAEITDFDGVVINPDDEGIFFSLDHPLLG